jgi:hypothetical protein
VLTIAREILSLPTASFRERRVRDYVKAFGYSCGAACVPLGNYHNRDFRRKKSPPNTSPSSTSSTG